MSRKGPDQARGGFQATIRHYHAPQREKRRRTYEKDEIIRRKILVVLRIALITLAVGILIIILASLLIDMAI